MADLISAAFDSPALLVEAQEVLRAANVYQCGETCGFDYHSDECAASHALLARLDAEIGEK